MQLAGHHRSVCTLVEDARTVFAEEPRPEGSQMARRLQGLSIAMNPSSSQAREIRARLEARRRELLVRYKDTLDHAEAELADDSGELVDVANDQWDARVLVALSEHDALALENIVAALYRLDTGHYGTCTRCREKINPARLQILPEVSHCAACATYTARRHRRTSASPSSRQPL
jgi:RNA polymerase-binding transcription factor